MHSIPHESAAYIPFVLKKDFTVPHYLSRIRPGSVGVHANPLSKSNELDKVVSEVDYCAEEDALQICFVDIPA